MKSFNNTAGANASPFAQEEAVDWLLQLNEYPDDLELAERFRRWRDVHPAHEIAWQRTAKAWQGLGALDVLEQDSKQSRQRRDIAHQPVGENGTISGGRRRRGFVPVRYVALASISAAAACLVILLTPVWLLQMQADHYTGTGEIRTVELQDGSRVTLAGASAIKVDLNDAYRGVELLSGEAFFDVAHMPKRPFEVTAANLNVSVLGTRFNVRQGQGAASVALQSGSVVAKSPEQEHVGFKLQPGELLRLTAANGAQKFQVRPEDIGIWRDYRLVVTNETVASVAEQIGRYQSGWVSVADAELASKRVTGVYDLANPSQALRTLVAPFGGKSIEITSYFRLLTAAN